MPEMTENQTPGHKPRKKKNKESHNAVERQRKEKINAGINRIGDLLPCSQALKQSKNMILDQAYLYISELQKQNDAMLLEGGERIQVEEIRRLRGQLDELRRESGHYIELLKAHDINFLDDPTVHWKGKLRCAKVAKVTPTHQLPEGIIVYSNGNVICPAGKEPSPASDLGKQPVITGIVQSSCDITAGVRVNVALQHVSVPSSAPPLLPKATLAPIVSTPGMKLVEQCAEEVPLAPKLPPSVSYITLQGICPLPTVTAALPQPATPAPILPIAASLATPLSLHPVPSCTALPQVITTQNAAIRTMSYTTINSSPTVLGASAAGSTQTTWTTLQLAGNTVQPVCQALPTPETSTSGQQSIQQIVGTKLSVQPIHIQMRPQVTIQPQAPITAHIQAQPSFQRTPQLRPAILAQPHCTVLPQSAIMPQPAVVAHSTMISRPQPAVQQQATVPSHPQTVLMTQPQPAMLPQVQAQAHPQAAVRPLLQTMQVLQMNPTGTAIAGVTTPQNTNNPSVVILQQANPCSAQSVVSDDLTNQTPCQHIVIIQASNQPPPAPPQNPQVDMVPAAAPNQIVATSSTTSTTGQQIVGGKQLVHILPRPVPQTQTPQAPPVPPNPQTITVNGQVFALQPMKTSEKSGCKGGQSSLQLIQPSTAEEPSTAKEPTTNMHTLGALSSLNQSISQGMPSCISTQSNVQRTLASPSYSIVPQQKPSSVPILAAPHSSPVRQIQIPSVTPHRTGLAMGTGKALWRQPETASVPRPKWAITKRTKLVSKKEPKQGRPVTISAKPVALTGDRLEQEVTVPQGIPSSVAVTVQPKPLPVSTTANTPTVSSSEASTQTRPVELSINSTLSSPEGNSVTTSSYSGPTVSSECTTQSKTSVTSVTPCTAAVSSSSIFSSTQSELIITSVVSLATVTSAADKPTVTSTVSSQSKQPAVAVSDRSTHLRPTVTQNRQPVTTTISTVQTRSAITNCSSRQSRSTGACSTETRSRSTGVMSSAACQPTVSTVNSIGNRPVVSLQSAQLTSSSQGQTKPANSQESQPTTQTQPVASPSGPSTPTPCSGTLSFASPSVTVPMTMPSEYRKWVPYNRPSTQQMTMPTSTPSHPAELKVTAVSGREKAPQAESHPSAAMEKASLRSDAAPSRMDYTLPQQVYVLDHEPLDQPPAPNRQTDSLMSGGAGGGRGFSVASMLPTGHSVSSSPGHFGSFTFASEQTDILAMLEQDSPGRRVGGCTVDNSTSTNTPTPAWEPNSKSQQASNSKERSAGQQTKLTKQMEPPVAKQVSVRVQAGDQTSAVRHPQNISFSQAHSHPQSQAQSGTSGTLSVNNLIRPSSSQQQAYPGSLSLAGQLGSVPSPAGNSAHVSQTSTPVLPPFSGSVQLNEYAPLRRPQVGVGEPRYIKDLSKRPAQDDVILSSSNKRQKTCSSASNVGRMEVKPLDHSQMMVPQLPPTTSSIMTRINPDGVGTVFAGNTFMSTMLRPTESHCTPQLPTQEHNQTGVLHLPHGHPQHGAPQPGQHLGGNTYLKQQQQQQQQQQEHHLYQLQHHLTQPDPAHLHSLHQRALQQVQKKRGLVGGGQKQHHQEKGGVQQHQHQQSQQSHQQQPQTHQQHQQQSQQQHQQQSQQQQQHQQQTQQQHQPQALSQQQHLQQHPQQQHQQQSSHSRHQHLQQQQIQHFGSQHQEKSCEAQPGPAGPRGHHSSHLAQEHLKSDQDHSTMQRLMSSRNLEQHLTSQPSNPAAQPSDLGCAPPRQDHHRVSSYSAEALIGKGSSSDEQQRMVLHLQATRGTTQEQPDLRGYLDTPRVKGNVTHNPQSRLPPDHPSSADVQRVSECPPFKTMASAEGGHQLGGFEDMTPKSGPSSQRGQQGGFRMNPGPPGDGQTRVGYSGPHPGTQGVQIGAPGLTRDQEGCHQSFMQSLLEQTDHQRAVQCCPPVSMEYGCVSGSSAGDMQAKASSPSVPPTQKASAMRLGEGNKGHIPHGSGNMGTHPGVRTGLPHPLTPHNSSDAGRTTASSRPPTTVSQRSRHITQETQSGKLRPGERPRSGSLRPGNPFEPDVHLLGRPQSGSEARRSSIVRFMADSAQVSGDNNLVPDQHLAQNFGFSFMPDGGLNLPPINANSTFIPPVSQTNSSRPSSLLPVEPQNTLPSFYPSYPPAAHPSLASDIPIQYFSNQMFTSPGADKSSSAPLNNRFGSILSPPRSVGFAQATFPLLSDMPPMPISNSSGITPHLSNFSLTSLFPEIATAMQPDGSAMPMSPLLSLSNNSSADSGKQPNRLAHNISHILGHDGSSAV